MPPPLFKNLVSRDEIQFVSTCLAVTDFAMHIWGLIMMLIRVYTVFTQLQVVTVVSFNSTSHKWHKVSNGEVHKGSG